MSEQNNNSLYNNSDYPPRQRTSPQERKSNNKKKRRKKSVGMTILKVIGTLMLIGITTGAMLCCFGAVYIKSVILPIAQATNLDDFNVGENSVMYYLDPNTGTYKEQVTLLSTTSTVWVDYEELPKQLIEATISIEDHRFMKHNGVDWKRTAGAVYYMMTGQDIQGGSTITQQLIKNQTNYNETTVKRKVVEIFRALDFDKKHSKEETITRYLNIIPLGSRCEGVGAAAETYFGKSVGELSLAECASLISITNNPSMYGPYSPAVFISDKTGEKLTARDMNKSRQETVLWRMLDLKKISQEEYDAAVAEELNFVRSAGENEDAVIYSWYEEQVISDVKADLIAQYDMSDSMANQMLSRGGLKIYSCMNPDVQAIAESVYTNRENLNYTSGDQKMQSAITIIDNTTGDVAAIVGRMGDDKTGNRWMNYATDAYRQPGSSIKPLTVYSPAIEMGLLSPISIIDDYPYEVMNGKAWPLNSGSARYKGLTTVQQGLTNSVNTIALRILADHVTPEASFQFMEQRYHIDLVDAMNVNGEIKSDLDRAPLSMGGLTKGVNTRDMAEAYASFPNDGIYRESRTYTKVTRVNNSNIEEVVLEKQSVQEQAVKTTTSYYMNTMLKNVVASGTGTAARFSNNIDTAGKTGTTSENHDKWFVGYTPYYTAAVWTGYEINAKIKTKESNPAITMWKLVMKEVHEGLGEKHFSGADGLVSVQYCLDSGLLASEFCKMDPRGSRVDSARVFKADAPTAFCDCHTAEENSLVTVCLDCPILNTSGAETGTYHIAGPFCPPESQAEYCLPNYDRIDVGGAIANDTNFLFHIVEGYGPCTVHTEEIVEPDPDEPIVDPDNPGTDPGTDPDNPGGEPGTEPIDPPSVDPNEDRNGNGIPDWSENPI